MKRIAFATTAVGLAAVASVALATPGAGTEERTQGATVTVSTNASRYAPGATVRLRIANRGDRRILVAGTGAFCSLVTVERLTRGTWKPLRPCAARATALYALGAGRSAGGVLGTARDGVVTGSATPGRLDRDLRTLPVLPLADGPAGKAREVPLGILPATTELGPGRYRLALRYRVGSAVGAAAVVRSAPFAVSG